jgi:hypothetical protein
MVKTNLINFTLSLLVCSSLYSCKKASTSSGTGAALDLNGGSSSGYSGYTSGNSSTSSGGSSTGGSNSTTGSTTGGTTTGNTTGGTTTGNTTGGTTTGNTTGGTTTGSTTSGTTTGGTTGGVCSGDTGEICMGGYDADVNKKEIPSKVWFLNPVGNPLTGDKQTVANSILNQANSMLVYENHRFIKFSTPVVAEGTAPSLNQILNSNYMINTYGSTEHYVLILVKGLVSGSGGTIGYSPGLRINWKSKSSIVVMDYDYVVSDPKGKQVIVHELFHGLGAPHTTDANGGQDNVFSNGVQIYKDIRSQGSYALNDRNMDHDFQIYIENAPSYQGVRSAGGYNWDTRTLMMWFATNTPLFLTSDTALNGAYSNILSVYYSSFVK